MATNMIDSPDLTPDLASVLYDVYWGTRTISSIDEDTALLVDELVALGLLEIDSNGVISTTPAGELAYEDYHGDPDEVLSAMW